MSAKRDYYEVLGLGRDAELAEIKSQYRKLALKFHPDRNKSADAPEHFKEISEAYGVLSDPEKRGVYDQHGHGGVGERYSTEDIFRGSGGFEDAFGGGGFGSIFDTIFGGGGPGRRRGSDILYKTDVTLEEVLRGKKAVIDLDTNVACDVCRASGCQPGTSKASCKACGGHGQIKQVRQTGFGSFMTMSACHRCRGQGTVIEKPCSTCSGRGTRRGRKHLEFEIPPGIDNGDYTVRGEGELVPGGENGDLIVRITVRPHAIFKRDGRDIFYDEEVTMVDAALGKKVTVPTLDDTREIKIDPGTQPNTIIKLRGRGVPHQGSGRGDQYVRIVVTIPKKLTKDQKKILGEFYKP
ncbi:DnaJ-class molecular chaperone [Cenarchaeum symbiosum A]|uniref:DnaJ-class molecular chaperone n=1 Tax=Cenarchaeum symbiosum (strain A) TaxID=414004 RepID=A0RZ02_CENSY|nr:DnaJ-class molecular chaperone [Cenarchaeum symbiosum A]